MKVGKVIFNSIVSLAWLLNISVYAVTGELPRFTIYIAMIVCFLFFVMQIIEGIFEQ